MSEDINSFIDALAQQNFNQAKTHFDEIIGSKMNDALEAEKINVANSIFNNASDDEDELDLDLEDEFVEDDDDVVEDEFEDDEENS